MLRRLPWAVLCFYGLSICINLTYVTRQDTTFRLGIADCTTSHDHQSIFNGASSPLPLSFESNNGFENLPGRNMEHGNSLPSQSPPLTTPNEALQPRQRPVPIVIISSIRPHYLEQLLESLQHQSPLTPSWLLKSPRYLFVHHHERNNQNVTALEQVMTLAKTYNVSVHLFEGLHVPRESLNVNANFAWYKMMRYLFGIHPPPHHRPRRTTTTTSRLVGDDIIRVVDDAAATATTTTIPNADEALILEEDIVLAPDALVMAAALFHEKWRRTDIHTIILGGWSGTNRINPDPLTFLAVRSNYFQAMGYSMDRILFDDIEQAKQDWLLYHHHKQPKNGAMVHDWTEEITVNQYVTNLTQLTPSVGRMKHIGVQGMGMTGNGATRDQLPITPWWYWNASIQNYNVTIKDYHLQPSTVTDMFGFTCSPLRYECFRLPHGVVTKLYSGEPVIGPADADPKTNLTWHEAVPIRKLRNS